MSRSRKDGRKRGAHRDTQGREVWSRRGGRKVAMDDPNDPAVRRYTHRHERRQGKQQIRHELSQAA